MCHKLVGITKLILRASLKPIFNSWMLSWIKTFMLAYSVMAMKDKSNHGWKLCVGLKGHTIFKWYLYSRNIEHFFFFVKTVYL